MQADFDVHCPVRIRAVGWLEPCAGKLACTVLRGEHASNGVLLPDWNPRTTDVAALAERLDGDTTTHWEHPRAGKRVTLWEQALEIEGIKRPLRRVLRLTERTIDAQGQLLIEPKFTLDGWSTSLSPKQFDRSSPPL